MTAPFTNLANSAWKINDTILNQHAGGVLLLQEEIVDLKRAETLLCSDLIQALQHQPISIRFLAQEGREKNDSSLAQQFEAELKRVPGKRIANTFSQCPFHPRSNVTTKSPVPTFLESSIFPNPRRMPIHITVNKAAILFQSISHTKRNHWQAPRRYLHYISILFRNVHSIVSQTLLQAVTYRPFFSRAAYSRTRKEFQLQFI